MLRAGPHTMRVALALREPYTGKIMEARGAVAIRPPDAMRMIMVGPGGTTALDLWVRGDRYRFSVPALDLLRRGDARTPRVARRGLPIDFLRWWMLGPTDGKLLWFERDAAGDRFLLRDGSAVVDLRVSDAGKLWARRTTWESNTRAGGPARIDEETVAADAIGCAPVHYHQASTGLSIWVRCEGIETERAPNPKAFDDPDVPGDEHSS
jgi:hypothetical protein